MSESGGGIAIDYNTYQYGKGEWIPYGVAGFAGVAVVLYLFYHSVIVSVMLGMGGAMLMLKYMKNDLCRKRKWQLMTEFKDGMDSLVSALVAGYSMEHAMKEAEKDVLLMYGKPNYITKEFGDIAYQLSLHRPLDELLIDFGERSGVEDIMTFAQIYATARKSGGNLVQVMRRTASNIGEKIEIQRDIETMIAGKKMEANCMMIIPLLIIVYMDVFSPGFLSPLYDGLAGRLFMTGALAVYIFSIIWSRRIMDIRM